VGAGGQGELKGAVLMVLVRRALIPLQVLEYLWLRVVTESSDG
jgi:hypothetical protein